MSFFDVFYDFVIFEIDKKIKKIYFCAFFLYNLAVKVGALVKKNKNIKKGGEKI